MYISELTLQTGARQTVVLKLIFAIRECAATAKQYRSRRSLTLKAKLLPFCAIAISDSC
jgi:hypothetical protein